MQDSTRCPICGAAAPAKGRHSPFCSSRCQQIDLGNWLGERYAVPGEPDEQQQQQQQQDPDADRS